MQNKNVYDKEHFYKEFAETKIAKQIQSDFKFVSWEKHFNTKDVTNYISESLNIYENVLEDLWENKLTPREFIGSKINETQFSMAPLYYLRPLLENQTDKIYDLGCGWNIFKKYIPNIVGIDASGPDNPSYYADEHDVVDDDFIQGHANFFESVFSICALDFYPIENLKKRVEDFVSMVKPGGRGFLTLNVTTLLYTSKNKNFKNNQKKEVDQFVRDQLKDIPINYIICDIDFTNINDSLDGNIRIVFER